MLAQILGNVAANQLERYLHDFPRFRFLGRRTKLAIFLPLFVLVSLLTLLLNQYNPVPTKTSMPSGSFNIAIGEIGEINNSGLLLSNNLGQELSIGIARFLDIQKSKLAEIMQSSVEVWGPEHGIGLIQFGEQVQATDDLNSDVLVYGWIKPLDSKNSEFQPSFYLSEDTVRSAEELYGEHALGKKLNYKSDSVASRRDINSALRTRIEALSQMLVGLSYLSNSTSENYDKAIRIFQDVVVNSEWGKENDNTGQEILYLFLGNASLLQLSVTDDYSEERETLLAQAKNAFSTAVKINPDYARGHNGLGFARLEMSRPLISQDDCEWKWVSLVAAEQSFRNALALPDIYKPDSGHVDFRSHLGLGQIAFMRGFCIDPTEWIAAETHYKNGLNKYTEIREPQFYLTINAATMHNQLGLMQLIQAEEQFANSKFSKQNTDDLLSGSIVHFEKALDLDANAGIEDAITHAVNIMPGYLTSLCLMGEKEKAANSLNEFLALYTGFSNDDILPYTPIWKECQNEN